MHLFMRTIVSVLIFLLGNASLRADLPIDAFYIDTLWTGDTAPVKNAVVVVQGGKILLAGPKSEVVVPAQAKKHELPGCSLMPGIVAMETSLAAGNSPEDQTLTPDHQAIDAFDFYQDFTDWLSSGITSAHISASGRRLMPGQGAMVKLGRGEPQSRTLLNVDGMKVILSKESLNADTVYEPPVGAVSVDRPLEPTRPQLGASLLELIQGLDALLESSKAKSQEQDSRLLAITSARDRKATFRITAETTAEIAAARTLTHRHALSWILMFPKTLQPLADDPKWDHDSLRGVVLASDFRPGVLAATSSTKEADEFSPSWLLAQKLVAMGFEKKIAIQPRSDADTKEILFLAKAFMRGGLNSEQIIRMLTANPARMSGLDGRIGSIRPGADADFLILNGEPLADGTEIVATYVNGVSEYSRIVSPKASTIAFSATQIVTPEGIITDGKLTVVNSKIIGVGKSVSVPTDAVRRHFEGGVIVPGFIDVGSQLGLGAPLTSQIGLETKLGELLARDDESIKLARQGGITTAFLSSTQLPSPVVAFKLGDQPRVIKDPVALKFSASGSISAAESTLRRTLAAGKQYSDAWIKYEAELKEYTAKKSTYEEAKKKYDDSLKAAEAKKAEDAKKADEQKKLEEEKKNSTSSKEDTAKPADGTEPVKPDTVKKGENESAKTTAVVADKDKTEGNAEQKPPEPPKEPTKPPVVPGLEPYRDLFAKRIVAIVDVKEDLLAEVVIRVFKQENDLKLVIVASDVAIKIADLAKKHGVELIVGPELVKTVRDETIGIPIRLSTMAVPFMFQSNSTAASSGLAEAIAYSVHKGLGRDQALYSLSLLPTKIFSLENQGTLEVGKDADFVVLNGPPMNLSTEVLAVVIDGQIVFERDKPE